MADVENAVKGAPAEAERPAEFSRTEPSTAGPEVQSGVLSCFLPDFSEACKLVNRPYSCLVVKTHRRPLALSPRYLNKKRSGIKEHLTGELLRYSTRLEGVPVAYDNVKIVGELADIQDDVGYIHLTIQADFVIFQPQQGEKLEGVVNKVAPSHIGCVVHGCFNASIPKPFKMPNEAWQFLGVKVGDHMEFEVFRLDSDAVGVFCIRGRLDKKMEADAIEKFELTEKQTNEASSADTEKATELGEDPGPKVSLKDPSRKEAKKRALPETLLPEDSGEMNTTLEEIPKKKRKRKAVNSYTDNAEVDAFIENIHAVDSAMESLHQSVDNIPMKEPIKKTRHSLPSVDIDNNIELEQDHISAYGNESFVHSSQEKRKKSKKKLNESVQNGITEESAFIEDAGLEVSSLEAVLETTKKKHKKKRKHSSAIEDSTLESANGETDVASQESLPDNFTIHPEIPKQKKRKRKHLADVSAEHDDYRPEDRCLLPADSQEFAEPKAKKKRKK